MSDQMLTLTREVRRRWMTTLLVAAGLVGSTALVSSGRALFSPLDADVDQEAAVYAFIGQDHGAGVTSGARQPRGRASAERSSDHVPAAFAARIQPEGAGGPDDEPTTSDEPLELASNGLAASSNFVAPPEGNPIGGPAPGDSVPGGPPPNPGGPTTDPETPSPNPTSPVPEPAQWLTMIVGFAFIGGLLRRARRRDRLELRRTGLDAAQIAR